MKAALIISHGSRSSKTKEEVLDLCAKIQEKNCTEIVECAFLEIEQPSIGEGIDICISKGATKVVVLLNFLNAGRHVDQDVPKIVEEAKMRHPNIDIVISKPVGQHIKIVDLFVDLLLGY